MFPLKQCVWGDVQSACKELTDFYAFRSIVIQSEAKNLGNAHVDVLVYASEILPPFGRLNDKSFHFRKNNPNTFLRIATTLKHDTATKSNMPTTSIGHQAPSSKDGNI